MGINQRRAGEGRRLTLEQLEERQLLATIPPAVPTGTPVVLPSTENASGVTIAQNASDSTHMVAVWTANDTAATPVFTRVQAAYSTNSGASWNSLTVEPSLLSDPVTVNPTIPYTESTDGSVAFDRNGNVYILSSQHNAGFTSGALVLQKFAFSGGAPSRIFGNEIVYQWVADAALNPTIAVDDTVGTFTDPDSGVTQTNPWTGNVYVAWNSRNAVQSNVNNPNPNVILVAGSHDGGVHFGPAVPVNDGSTCIYNPVAAPVPPPDVLGANCGISNTNGEFDTTPRLVVSQGTAGGGVPAGQLNIVWDDFGTNRSASPPTDRIMSDRLAGAGLGFTFTGFGGAISEADDPGGGQPHIPGVSSFPITVNVGDGRFVSLSDLDVRVDMLHYNLSEISLELVAPNGTVVTLAPSRINAAGTANNNIGLAGTALGILNGINVGLVFDQDAARSIFVGTTPYVGHFRPQGGNLDVLNGLNATQVNGSWILRITDFRETNATASLSGWSISLNSGMTPGQDRLVATTFARGSANGPYPRSVPASPNRGVAPSAVIASDNTLGSFSPFQGRLYVAYTDFTDDEGNDSNVFVRTSDNGGLSWSGSVRVNDDSTSDGTTGSRSQFNPTVAVDQTTGTVVTAWLDAREDAANARTATYVSASIDGGQAWSKNVFLNKKHAAENGYDQSTLVYGPVPDNQSTGNPARDARFNFGDHIGLVVSGGRVTASWAGNENVTPLGTPPDCCTTEAMVARANITAGPRIISSTMGWVDAASSFNITFDRPVDPGTFGVDDVRLWRRDVYGIDSTVNVTAVTPTSCGADGCTSFFVSFDSQTEIGTYRYAVGPDISDRIRLVAPAQRGNEMDQNANGINNQTASANSPPLFNSSSRDTHDVYLTPQSFDDTNTLPLQVTGPRLASGVEAQRVGVEYSAIDPSTTLGLAHIDGGVITRTPSRALTDGATTTDTINVSGSFAVSDLNVRLNIAHARVEDLDIVLRHVPTNQAITLVADVPASGANFTNTILDDESAASIQSTTSSAPFTGSFRPRDALSGFDGLNAQGQWRLEVTDDTTNGIAGTLNSWTLDFGVESKLPIADHVPITDLDVFIDLASSDLSDLRVELTRDDNLHTIDYDPTTIVLFDAGDASGTTMSRTVFSDEASAGIAPGGGNYRFTFRPDGSLFLFDDSSAPFSQSDTNGTWKLRVTDTSANGSTGTLNNWGLIVNPNPTFDRLGLHATANFMDFTFDRDMDPSTFTTVDVNRIIGPEGQIGANPLGPFRYSPLDTTPTPVPIPDGGRINSTINVSDNFAVGDVDVLVEISHPKTDQLQLFLIAPDGTRVELVNNLSATATPNLINTILDDEAVTGITAGTAPYAGRFRPAQPNGLSLFDGTGSQGTWTLEVNDKATGSTGTLVRWNLVLTRDPNRYASTLPAPLAIPDNGTIVNDVITVPDSYPIHDLEVTLNITHPQPQDLAVTLVGPDGTRVPLVANLVASGANLSNIVLDDEGANIISTGEPNGVRCAGLGSTALVNPSPSCSTTFRPVLQRLSTDRVSQLSDFDGLDSKGTWTLEIRDRTAGNSSGTQQLEGWALAITPSDLRVLPNPAGTDPNPNFPRTYRVYFPRQILSGTYAVSIAPNILSQAQSLDARCFPTGVTEDRSACGLDVNRNAGLAALRRGDGFANLNVTGVDLRPGGLDTAVDFQSTYDSRDVGDAVSGRPIPEPIAGAVRPITSRIFIPDNIIIADLNIRLTITDQQPPGSRPLMRDDDYDVFLISPNGTRLELFSDVGGDGVNFVDLFLNDEALRCQPSCQPIYIQDGSAPFSNDFRPELLGPNGLKVFDGEQARGVWTLEIIDDTANGLTAALRSWSLEISGRTTGLAELAADQISSSFRLFVMDPSDPRSSTAWTAVGPAALGLNGNSSRSGGIAVDPSDPSGNTVFFAGATSGVWKTTNFLTTDSQGPTWVPLTDFAPTNGLHIGSIAVLPRNNDPEQTIVYVATGESDAGFIGVGVLKSEDGGATWRLQDSLNNDPNIPFALRGHELSGTTSAFKIIVDPTFADGRVAYMALSGARGGIYKTVNGGQNWVLSRAGQATDVVLDPVNTEVVYSAFRGEGVFISSNRGAQWLLTAGATNNVQVRDADPIGNPVTLPIGPARGSPNGAKGRISLAKPWLTGNVAFDRAYEGRLFAVVATPNSLLDGVYVTSDFGANWTQLKLGQVDNPDIPCDPPIPTTDDTATLEVDPFTTLGCISGQGNYDQAILVDPKDPNRVYVFGAADVPVISIDVALTYDGHHYNIFDHDNADGGLTQLDTVGGSPRKLTRDDGDNPPLCEPFAGTSTGSVGLGCNFSVSPATFVDDGSLSQTGVFAGNFNNIANFANNGFETRWAPMFFPAHVDYHDVDVMIDPLTGKTRILVGTDGGIFSALVNQGYDANGDPIFSSGSSLSPFASPSIGNSFGPANGSRNGNLQMSQIYGGATHPSQLAAELAFLRNGGNGGLFYNATQDNGSNHSNPFILQNGNLVYSGYGVSGDSGAGLTTTLDDNDTNLHTVYIFEWACCMPAGQEAGVIRRNRVPAVAGLDQENLDQNFGGPTNDLTINARDGNELLYSAPSGRLYKTDDGGRQWLPIGEPSVFNTLQASAMTFGSEQPDPDPSDLIEPDEVIYIGLPNGRLLSSLTEGGDAGQEWFDISFGLTGGAVQDISANIRQNHYDVYLVTQTRVFFMPNAKAAIDEVRANGVPGSNVNNPWIDITGNLRNVTHTVFPGAWSGEGTLGPIVDVLPQQFSSIKVDDRYDIPDAQGVRHPLVYVGAGNSPGGGGGAGVYRTFDNGGTWRRYPDPEIDGAAIQGGYLPNVGITEIELALGPIDPETGLSDFTQSLDLLVAHTYGRGSFAVRSAPLIFNSEGGLISNSPDLLDADDSVPPVPPFPPVGSGTPYDQDNITNHDGSVANPLHFTGLTHRGATVHLLEDKNGILTEIGRGGADFFTGDWTVAVGDTDGDGTPDGLTLDCGQHVIRAQASSASGTVGQVSDPITITVLNEPPVELVAPDLLPADDTGSSSTDNITSAGRPRFSGATFCGVSGQPVPQAIVRLMVRDPAGTIVDPNDPNPATNRYRSVGLANSAADGSWTVQVDALTPALTDGTYVFVVRAEDLAGNIGPLSPTTVVQIDTQVVPAPAVTSVTLDTCAPLASSPPTPCTFGSRTDLITNDQTLILGGTAEPNSTVTLQIVGGAVLSSSIAADASGNWSFDNTAQTLLPDTYSFTASAIDIAGNSSAPSAPIVVVIDTTIAQPSAPDLVAASDLGASNSDDITSDDTPTFTGTAEPLSQIQFFDGASPLGAPVVADAAGSWTFTSPSLLCVVALGCSHDFSVVATDLAGNVSQPSAVLTVTIDTIAPSSPPSTPDLDAASDSTNSCPPPAGTNTDNYTKVVRPTFTGTAEPNTVVTVFEGNNVRLGSATAGPDNGSGVGDWSFTGSTNLLPGVHLIFARITDLAGNEGPASGTLTVTIDTAVSAPTNLDLSATSDTGNSSTDNLTSATTLTFSGMSESAPGNGCVEVTATPTSGGGAAISLGFASVNASGSWTLVTSVALADGTYSVVARATDLAGNVSGNSTALAPNLVIDRTPPNPPTLPDLTVGSDTGISSSDNITRDDTPTFTGNATAGTRVELFRDCNTVPVSLGTPVNPAANGQWTFTSQSLTDGTYAICAAAADAAGNQSTFSPILTVVIDTVITQPLPPDLDPLSDTGISSTDNITRDNTPTFTNGPNSAEANSALTIFDGNNPISTIPVSANGSWTLTLSTPLPDGQHSVTARAIDVAGNQSQSSLPLTLVIDTQIVTPVITSITEDRGPSSTDHNTNDQTLLLQGTAEAGSTVVLSQTGAGVLAPCPLPSPDVVADAQGNWVFDNTCRVIPEGNVSFSATATDAAGNTSVASALFDVVIDITAPGSPPGAIAAPTLEIADDTGIQGDNITRLRRPRLTGVVTGTGVANIQVEILDASNTVLGTARTSSSGSYTVQFANDLSDGSHIVSIRATDDAGNSATSSSLTFTVDATPPRILSFTPAGTLTVTTSQIVVQFSEDNLNQTVFGDAAFAGSVRNLSNFRLTSSTQGDFDLSTSQFQYDTVTDRLVINLRNSSGAAVRLPNGNWQFRINGTTSLQDIAGNRLDGENPGVRPGQTTPFPTGNDVEGGDFVSSFIINVPPAGVMDIHMAGTKKVVSKVIIDFSQPLNRSAASSMNAFQLIDAGRDRVFDTVDDIPIRIGLPSCNPLPADCTTVTVEALRGQSLGRFFLLKIAQTVTDVGGNPVDSATARSLIGRGKSLNYTDSNGDLVNVTLANGGLMDVIRYGNGEGRFIHIERDVRKQSAIPGKSALRGTVTRAGSGDGVTHFDAVTGTNRINLNEFRQPPFIVPPGQISAQVVDRLLTDGDSATDLLADSVVSVLSGRKHRRSR